MDKKSKKQIEAELLKVIQEILVRHNSKAAGEITKQTKAAMKKIAKKFIKAAKSFEKKKAKKVSGANTKKGNRTLKVIKKAK